MPGEIAAPGVVVGQPSSERRAIRRSVAEVSEYRHLGDVLGSGTAKRARGAKARQAAFGSDAVDLRAYGPEPVERLRVPRLLLNRLICDGQHQGGCEGDLSKAARAQP